jgi:hypothetical protein
MAAKEETPGGEDVVARKRSEEILFSDQGLPTLGAHKISIVSARNSVRYS